MEKVIRQDAPLEIYRNPFLTEAMVAFNMIDTQGGGIKRMFQIQRHRFFPLPDFDTSDAGRVAVKIPGRILDPQYTRLLIERTDLDLWHVILLDRLQKRLPISREAHRSLKASGLVEGRYPNLIIAGPIAGLTEQKAQHIRDRGLDRRYYLDMILALVAEHGPVDRKEVDETLWKKLPEVLTERQKRAKIHNLLSDLSRTGKIRNSGTRSKPKWEAI